MTDLCDRLARNKLGILGSAPLLEQARTTFRPQTRVKMMFEDPSGEQVWYKGWVLRVPDEQGRTDVLFDDGMVETEISLLMTDGVDNTAVRMNPEIETLENDIDEVVFDVVEAMVHSATVGSDNAETVGTSQDLSLIHI